MTKAWISTVLVVLAAILLAAPLAPLASSKSGDPCASCHNDGRYMYLDILEGDPGNSLPAAIGTGQTLQVAAVVEVTCNSNRNNVMSSITATLASQNGMFAVAAASYTIGSLGNGQRATAFWNITPVSPGSDVLVITARGQNTHKNLNFQDTYAPAPAITVTMGGYVKPTLGLTAPTEGQKVKGTIQVTGTAAKGTAELASVQVRVDSGVWTNASGTASWQLSLDTTKLKNGQHTIDARAFDGTGYSDTVSRTVTVDNQKAGGGSTPMMDGLVAIALLGASAALFALRRR